MDYDSKFENVSVIGAAGKMGSGIVLIILLEMASIKLKRGNSSKTFVLNAIDLSQQALNGQMNYLKDQVLRSAEKRIVALREIYKDSETLIENKEIIDQYVSDVLSMVQPSTTIQAANESKLIFEAVIENPELKINLLSEINKNNTQSGWIFSNTSSVPIHELDEKAGLQGRIAGFHFYNPPPVQKLVELITTDKTVPEIIEFAKFFAKKLQKTIVHSNDIAGFIGNGHFMRDVMYAMEQVKELSKELTMTEAIWAINRISQDFLIRPMGIVQLVDYVGLDVCQFIMNVMNDRLDEEIRCPLLDEFLQMGLKGGQFSDGTQNDGILKYEKNKIIAVFDLEQKAYIFLDKIDSKVHEYLGPLPSSHLPWKTIIRNPLKEKQLQNYFSEIKSMKTKGPELSIKYSLRSKDIALHLVKEGVAKNEEDVNSVLLTGFYHVYGPIHDYLQ